MIRHQACQRSTRMSLGQVEQNLRTAHPDDWLTDEEADQTLNKLKKGIQGNTTNKYGEKAKATSRLQEVITDAQYALDLAFSAGTLATPAGIARPDSVQYADKLQDEKYKEALDNAKI